MPTIHIAGHLGSPLEISDTFGADFASVDLLGKVVRIAEVRANEIVIELVQDMPASWPNAFTAGVSTEIVT
jgi:hypothetical protein